MEGLLFLLNPQPLLILTIGNIGIQVLFGIHKIKKNIKLIRLLKGAFLYLYTYIYINKVI